MALVKKIELELHGELGMRRGFYIGLFDSNGNAYNFSPTIDSDFIDGMKTMTAELSLNDDLVGSVTVAPAQNYGGNAVCYNHRGFRLYDRGLWLDIMLYFYFGVQTDQPGPY